MIKINKDYELSPQAIDELSNDFTRILEELDVGRKDAIRLRISIEDILGIWLDQLGENARTNLRTSTRLRRTTIQISVTGGQVDPDLIYKEAIESGEDDGADLLLFSSLMSLSGLAIKYSYKNGRNIITLQPCKQAGMGEMTLVILSILLAVILGGLSLLLPEPYMTGIREVIDPVFNTILNAIKAISSPLIFLSISWGIVGIGDLSTVGKIGKKVISRMLIITLVIGVLVALILLPLMQLKFGSGSGGGFSKVYQMVLDIVPGDIVSPFMKGQALQVIFLGCSVGLALLVLSERVAVVRAMVEQANEVVQLLMSVIGKIMPLFIFLSIYSIFLSGMLSQMKDILMALVFVSVGSIILPVIYVVYMALRTGISPVLAFRKILPVWLIGLTTASSSAALSTNMEVCERSLGISSKVVSFAVPLSQVIFKPSAVIEFLVLSFYMAQTYEVNVSMGWVITAIISCWLLAVAATPVAGGTMAIYTILFSQLGLPAEAVALAIAVNMPIDFVTTAANLASIQAELVLDAKKLKILDKEILAREVAKG